MQCDFCGVCVGGACVFVGSIAVCVSVCVGTCVSVCVLSNTRQKKVPQRSAVVIETVPATGLSCSENFSLSISQPTVYFDLISVLTSHIGLPKPKHTFWSFVVSRVIVDRRRRRYIDTCRISHFDEEHGCRLVMACMYMCMHL